MVGQDHHGPPDPLDVAVFQMTVEERPSDDGEGEGGHILVDVPCLSVGPRGDEGLRLADHRFPPGSNAVVLERRLHDASMLSPRLPLAEDEPIANHHANPTCGPGLAEVAALRDEKD